MLSKVAKLLLTGTAIAPVAATYGWVQISAENYSTGLILWAVCILMGCFCAFLISRSKQHLERIKFKPASIEAADRENIAFLLLYLLPLFTADLDNLNWNIWAPTIIIFAIVISTGYNYHFNPLLGLFGWHFYKVGTSEGVTYVLITQKELRTAQQNLTVGQLTEYIVLDVGDK